MAKTEVFKMGDPYYCSQCERDHIKGKIYKTHINYAQDGDSEEEIEKIDDLDEEEIEKIDDLDEEKKEILDAFEDLGIEIDEDSNFDEAIVLDDEEGGLEDVDLKESAEECVKAVKSLPGVGEATLNKLVKAGFNSLESIAYTPPKLIREDSGLGEKTVAKLIKSSMELLNIGFKTGTEVWEHRKNISRISTGSQELDDLLGGGVETGSLIEFYGEFRTGKTQIMHQLCVNVQLAKEQGGLGGNALYIDTEGTFRPERIIQMSENLDLDYTKVLKNIVYGRAYNSDHQLLLAKEAGNIIKEKKLNKKEKGIVKIIEKNIRIKQKSMIKNIIRDLK